MFSLVKKIKIQFKYFLLFTIILSLLSSVVYLFYINKHPITVKLEDCNARIAVVGHLYSIVGRVKVEKGKKILKTFPEIMDALTIQLNKLNLDAVVLTGDITQHNTKEEWDIVNKLIKSLNAKIYAVPGNHDTGNEGIAKNYLKHFDKLTQVVDVRGCNLILINSTNGDDGKYDYKKTIVGNTVSQVNIQAINSVDKNKINLLMMHHMMTTKKFDQNTTFNELFAKQQNAWDVKIVPLLKNYGIKNVYTGDHFVEALSFVQKDGISYINSTITMDRSSVYNPPMFILISAKNGVIRNEAQLVKKLQKKMINDIFVKEGDE